MDCEPDADLALPPEAEARLQALLEEQRVRREREEAARTARRRLWYSHHWADDYHRCALVAGRPVCRRCLALYPVALMTMAFALAGFHWPEQLDPWVIWAACVPATLEFVAEKLRGIRYSARRQALVTMLVAPALGRGLAYELDDRWHRYFWGPVLVFGTAWFAAAVYEYQQRMMRDALHNSIEFGPDA
jgi:hypothetical protein